MGAIALVLDRAWIDGARVELAVAADAAALAAGQQLAYDDLLRPDAYNDARLQAACDAAAEIAAQNLVAGNPVEIDRDADVLFGKIAHSASTGRTMFLETSHRPLAVVVAARALRSRGNPVALWIGGLTGQAAADVSCTAEAAIDNHLMGCRARPDCPIPAFPLAILADDSASARTDTWNRQIVARRGGDVLGYDEKKREVTAGPDGIPEMLLYGFDPANPQKKPNAAFISMNGPVEPRRVEKQIADGWQATDLADADGLLPLPARPFSAAADSQFRDGELALLQQRLGECRICLLYVPDRTAAGVEIAGQVRCVGIVAGRVLRIIKAAGHAPQIVFQPGVLVTHSALTATDPEADRIDPERACRETTNDYVYKLRLTR
jgi:hypothetical protein